MEANRLTIGIQNDKLMFHHIYHIIPSVSYTHLDVYKRQHLALIDTIKHNKYLRITKNIILYFQHLSIEFIDLNINNTSVC